MCDLEFGEMSGEVVAAIITRPGGVNKSGFSEGDPAVVRGISAVMAEMDDKGEDGDVLAEENRPPRVPDGEVFVLA